MIQGLWKTVEIFCALLPKLAGDGAEVDAAIAAFENRLRIERLRACSGCAGDYEDPDRTAWTEEDPEEQDPEAEHRGPGSEFPVQCK
jgi:hypothetical protein